MRPIEGEREDILPSCEGSDYDKKRELHIGIFIFVTVKTKGVDLLTRKLIEERLSVGEWSQRMDEVDGDRISFNTVGEAILILLP